MSFSLQSALIWLDITQQTSPKCRIIGQWFGLESIACLLYSHAIFDMVHSIDSRKTLTQAFLVLFHIILKCKPHKRDDCFGNQKKMLQIKTIQYLKYNNLTYLTGGLSLNTTAKYKNSERESIVFPALYISASIL